MTTGSEAAASDPVVLLAHGSRDPRNRAALVEIADSLDLLRRARGGDAQGQVTVAFLDHSDPDLVGAVLACDAPAGAGVAVVPMLLTSAFHARVDVPAALEAARAARSDLELRLTAGLGPDPRLLGALDRRLAELGTAGRLDRDRAVEGVLVLGVGSSDPSARADVAAITRRWAGASVPATHAFVTGEGPSIAEGVADLVGRGARRVLVAPYVLAPGLLIDRGTEAARRAAADLRVELTVADPLGAAPEVLQVILDRITKPPA